MLFVGNRTPCFTVYMPQSPDCTEHFMNCTVEKVMFLLCSDVVQCRLVAVWYCLGQYFESHHQGQSSPKVFCLDSLTIIHIISTQSSVKIIYDKSIPHKFCIYILTNKIYSKYACWSSGKSIIEGCNIFITHLCVTVITLRAVCEITEA
jgi:hypothetical protein